MKLLMKFVASISAGVTGEPSSTPILPAPVNDEIGMFESGTETSEASERNQRSLAKRVKKKTPAKKQSQLQSFFECDADIGSWGSSSDN
jgi:hypothetical protein